MNRRPFALFVVVQADDGRWNFGPVALAEALHSEEFGTYPTEAQARAAALDAIYGRVAA